MPALRFDRFRRERLEIVRASRRKNTYDIHRQALSELAALGPRSTRDLTPDLIARFVEASRLTPGRGDIRTHALLRAVKAACTYAVKMRYLHISPFDIVDDWGLDLEPADITRHLTMDEAWRLLEHLREGAEDSWKAHRLYALASTVAYTALRRGEALHLAPGDVDFGRGFLWVARRRLAWRSKTRRSAAPVPMPPPLVPILEAWIPRCGSEWLFPGVRRETPWTGGSPGEKPLDQLQAAGREVGLEAVTFQMLRHTFATHAPSWGIGPIHLKQILRHTTLRTQRHYIHEDPEGLIRAASRVSFDGPSPG